MDQHFPYWLSKQMITGVKGFNMDAYLVALEGWRRGLTLKWYGDAAHATDLKLIGYHPLGKTFSLHAEDKAHFFYRSRGDAVKNDAVDIASNKEETKQYLAKASVPHPEGFAFRATDNKEEIISKALSMGFPLVTKPTFGSLGKGVITNIQTEIELRDSVNNINADEEYTDFIIERFLPGFDLRVYVVGDKVLGAIKRVPANVVGDGTHSIKELIQLKNDVRKENPYLATKLIKHDNEVVEHLFNQNKSLTSIPDKDEVIYLKGKSNVSAGGDPVDYTEQITAQEKEIAIQAVQSIPGLTHAGVDLIVTENDTYVIEINATADIVMHVFPLIGQARHIPEGIIDYYFPETIGLASNRHKIYFDYRRINNLIREGVMQEIQITDAPNGELYAKRYVISGKVQKVGYRNWIRKEALKRNLSGYARNLRNGKVVVVVGGADKKQVNNFKNVCYKGPQRAKAEVIKEFVWESQIKSGFEIRKMN